MGLFKSGYQPLPPELIVEAGGDVFDPEVIGQIYQIVIENDVAVVREAVTAECAAELAEHMLDKYHFLQPYYDDPNVDIVHEQSGGRQRWLTSRRNLYDRFGLWAGEENIFNYMPFQLASDVHSTIMSYEPPPRLAVGCEVINLLQGNFYPEGGEIADHPDATAGVVYSLSVMGEATAHLHGQRLGGDFTTQLYAGDLVVLPSFFGMYTKNDQTVHGMQNVTPDEGIRLALGFGHVPGAGDPTAPGRAVD